MKLFKKAIFLFLAILPMIPFFQLAVTSIGNDSATQIIAPPTSVFITDDFVSYGVPEGEESLMTKFAQQIIPPYNDDEPHYREGTLMYAIVGLAGNLQSALSNHMFYTDYMVVAFGLIVYYFYIILLMSLADILTFVPRKCAEIFGGKS